MPIVLATMPIMLATMSIVLATMPIMLATMSIVLGTMPTAFRIEGIEMLNQVHGCSSACVIAIALHVCHTFSKTMLSFHGKQTDCLVLRMSAGALRGSFNRSFISSVYARS